MPAERKTERVDWRLTPELRRRLEEYAAGRSMSVAAVLESAVRREIDRGEVQAADERDLARRMPAPVPERQAHRSRCKCLVCVAVYGKDGHP